jgi:hypothetical protein
VGYYFKKKKKTQNCDCVKGMAAACRFFQRWRWRGITPRNHVYPEYLPRFYAGIFHACMLG